MSPDDMRALGRELAPVIRRFVDEAVKTALAPVDARLSVVESRPAPRDGVGIAGVVKSEGRVLILTLSDGKVVDTGIRDGVDGRDGKDGAPGHDGKDGRDGQNGKDADLTEVKGFIASEVRAAREADPPQADDRERPTLDEVASLVEASVKSSVAALAATIVVPEAQPGPPGPQGPAGSPPDPQVIRKMVDEAASRIEVPEGRPGRDGRDGLPGIPGPAGRDGADGRDGVDGKDGLGFEEMSEELDADGRTVVRRYARGEKKVEFRHRFAVPLYRGVWRDGAYAQGDMVTWGGSVWVAQRDTSDKPQDSSEAWKLAVKRGRDGKDLRPEVPDTGPVKVGKPGR